MWRCVCLWVGNLIHEMVRADYDVRLLYENVRGVLTSSLRGAITECTLYARAPLPPGINCHVRQPRTIGLTTCLLCMKPALP